MRVRGLTTALLLTTAAAAGAQSAGSFEINGFGRYTRFDDTLRLDDKFGGGGSLGFFLLTNLALEGEGAYTATDNGPLSVTNIPLRARLSYHVPLGGNASSIRLGAGYVRNLYRKDVDFDDDGLTGILGVRLGLTEKLGFRVDGTVDYVPGPAADRADNYVNWGAQAGFSLLFGNSLDADHDRVRNSADRCPRTQRGQPVDASGCAPSQLDRDRDQVNDAADRCPDSPLGQAVDAQGCSAAERDADQDRIIDIDDRCRGTPAGERVDQEGCSESQKDDDRDGVVNTLDRCPDSRADERVDSTGCVPGPQDSDKDGVADPADQCANTAAGEPVDSRGCPRDSDGDRVSDGRDRCPSTPSGQAVDENGCPILFQKGARTVILRGVTFPTGRANLTPGARGVLRDIATQLAENPEYRVQVSGHTDNTGSRAGNLRLSLARARTVMDFLVGNGVSPRQLTAKGFGPDVPIASNKTAAGRAKNRRVELNRIN